MLFLSMEKIDWDMNYFAAQVIANQIAVKAYQQNLFNSLPAKQSNLNPLTICIIPNVIMQVNIKTLQILPLHRSIMRDI